LTVEQVLSDYVELLAQIKDDYQVQHKATIAFGGSYGGMLAAWFRMKYPHVIQGALAASAPIRYFRGFKDVDEHGFMEVAS
jgi:lysosomal Pro-X carboxypeptidase